MTRIPPNTTRRKLDNRRPSISFNFRSNSLAYTATISRYSNGDLAEIFTSNSKAGSQSDSAAKNSAVFYQLCQSRGLSS